MKKHFLFIMVALLVAWACARVSFADTIFYNANQSTIGWDAVTTDVDGDPVTCTYEVFIVNAITDPGKTNPVIVPVTANEYTMTIGVKGRYFVGVRAVLDADVKSEINWADLPDYQTVAPFGIKYLALPNIPMNIHK